uniref:AccI family restriction endonuclease n=1 Tax=candidate division WOR-3 bacterium TaxID=2052148 RepID=A0A7C4TCB1_UNCW3
MDYLHRIDDLIRSVPEDIINLSLRRKRANPPTQAFSEFITNREQGDWAEDLLFRAIQEINRDIVPVRYGRSDKIVAGEAGFKEFYNRYQDELDELGKRPDLLIFRKDDYDSKWNYDITSLDAETLERVVPKAIAAFEIRSSAFLVEEYKKYITKSKKEKRQRQFLSFTPKVEDIYVIYKWIKKYGVPHFYVQVFFDKVYCISFEDILGIVANKEARNSIFFVERNAKNQFKSTIHINIDKGLCLAEKIEMPEHKSEIKKLERGRLLFYVTFKGGYTQIDLSNLMRVLTLG